LSVPKTVKVQQTHKRILLFVGYKLIQPGIWAFDEPMSEMVEAFPFGVNLNVEVLLAREPAMIKNDLAVFLATTIACACGQRMLGREVGWRS
jgi:hypothetical protein